MGKGGGKMHGTGGAGKTSGGMRRAIGLMSGTSLDGIDIAVVDTDGADQVCRGPGATVAYPPQFRARLREAIAAASSLTDRGDRPGALAEIEQELTERHGAAVAEFLDGHRLAASDIDVIGFHGQTVLHRPARRLTIQIGNGARLAALTGIDVVYDLRAADCAAGGQGAPLVPVYHRALAAQIEPRPLAFLNIGGIANVTWISREGALHAFDTGPGNALLDDWVLQHTGQACDAGGALARRGTVDERALGAYLAADWFRQPPPKTLDRGDFTLAAVAGAAPADGAATLTRLTVTAIVRSLDWMPAPPKLWVVSGGGRRNTFLMVQLAEALGAPVIAAEDAGLDGDRVEAEAWAYLAVRALAGLPITYPETTGAPGPLTGGVIVRAPGRIAV